MFQSLPKMIKREVMFYETPRKLCRLLKENTLSIIFFQAVNLKLCVLFCWWLLLSTGGHPSGVLAECPSHQSFFSPAVSNIVENQVCLVFMYSTENNSDSGITLWLFSPCCLKLPLHRLVVYLKAEACFLAFNKCAFPKNSFWTWCGQGWCLRQGYLLHESWGENPFQVPQQKPGILLIDEASFGFRPPPRSF